MNKDKYCLNYNNKLHKIQEIFLGRFRGVECDFFIRDELWIFQLANETGSLVSRRSVILLNGMNSVSLNAAMLIIEELFLEKVRNIILTYILGLEGLAFAIAYISSNKGFSVTIVSLSPGMIIVSPCGIIT